MAYIQQSLPFEATETDVCWMCRMSGDTTECANRLRAKHKNDNGTQPCRLIQFWEHPEYETDCLSAWLWIEQDVPRYKKLSKEIWKKIREENAC